MSVFRKDMVIKGIYKGVDRVKYFSLYFKHIPRVE